MKLERIRIVNLFSFEDIETNISDDKTLILGVNNDEIGLSSNGSGKSAVFGSAYWVLFGKTLDGRASEEVLRKGTEEGMGILVFDTGLTVHRSVDAKNNKHLTVTRGTEDVTASTNTKTQDVLNELLGCDHKSFLHSHYMSSDFSKAFIGKDTTPRERFEVFERFIDAETLTACKKLCESRIRDANHSLNLLEGERSGYNTIVNGYDADFITTQLEEQVYHLNSDEAQLETCLEELAKLEQHKEAHVVLNTQKEMIDKLDESKKRYENLKLKEVPPVTIHTELQETSDKLANLNRVLQQIEKPQNCPECNAPLVLRNGKLQRAMEVDEEALVKEKNELVEKVAELMGAGGARIEFENEVNSLQNSITMLEGNLKPVDADSANKFDADRYVKVQMEINKFRASANNLRTTVTNLEKDLESLANATKLIKKTEKAINKEHKEV